MVIFHSFLYVYQRVVNPIWWIPSGKLTQLWKTTIVMGKSTINGNFQHIAMLGYQRVHSLRFSWPEDRVLPVLRSLRLTSITWTIGLTWMGMMGENPLGCSRVQCFTRDRWGPSWSSLHSDDFWIGCSSSPNLFLDRWLVFHSFDPSNCGCKMLG